jgi:hypothetical protein
MEAAMLRVICIALPLDDENIRAADAIWREHDHGGRGEALVLSGIDAIVQRLRLINPLRFRIAGHGDRIIHWLKTGLVDAVVQERLNGRLLRVHQLTRGPLGEVYWQERVADGVSDNNYAMADAILIPAFAVVTEAQWRKHHAHLRRHLEESP